jgi:MFS family permease
MAFSSNYIMFTICRFLIGTLLGIVIPMLFGILTEYLPIKYRAFVLVSVWTGFGLGEIYTLIMMLIFTPNYEISGVPSVLFSCSIPFALIALSLFLFLDESPRMLILEKRETEGLRLLELMTKKELTNQEKDQIVGEIKGGINKELQASLKYLFHHDFFKISIILIIIWAFNSFILYGGKFTLQQTLTRISSAKSVNNKPKDVIIEQIIIQFIILPGNFISPIFSEIKFLGRIYSTALFYLLASFFQFMACVFKNHFSIWYGFSNLCSGSAFNISSAYTSEVYPTLIRDIALGFFYFCTRVAGFSSQFVSVSLENVMFLLQYYTIIMICLLGAIIVSLLPVETYGSPIDMPIINDRIILEKPAIEDTKKCSI